jgi:hypothetical protein
MSSLNYNTSFRRDFFEILTQAGTLKLTNDNFSSNLNIFFKDVNDLQNEKELESDSHDDEMLRINIFSKKIKFFFLRDFSLKKNGNTIPNIFFLKNFFTPIDNYKNVWLVGSSRRSLKKKLFYGNSFFKKMIKQKLFFKRFSSRKSQYTYSTNLFCTKNFFRKFFFVKTIRFSIKNLLSSIFLSRYIILKN